MVQYLDTKDPLSVVTENLSTFSFWDNGVP